MRNKYIKKCENFIVRISYYFTAVFLEIDAKKVSEFTGLNRVTINRIFYKLRVRTSELCEYNSPFVNGEIELDESYFGARRVRGIRGRGARGKIPVFGILKRGDKVYTQIVKNCSMSELMPIIQGKAANHPKFGIVLSIAFFNIKFFTNVV